MGIGWLVSSPYTQQQSDEEAACNIGEEGCQWEDCREVPGNKYRCKVAHDAAHATAHAYQNNCFDHDLLFQ